MKNGGKIFIKSNQDKTRIPEDKFVLLFYGD